MGFYTVRNITRARSTFHSHVTEDHGKVVILSNKKLKQFGIKHGHSKN